MVCGVMPGMECEQNIARLKFDHSAYGVRNGLTRASLGDFPRVAVAVFSGDGVRGLDPVARWRSGKKLAKNVLHHHPNIPVAFRCCRNVHINDFDSVAIRMILANGSGRCDQSRRIRRIFEDLRRSCNQLSIEGVDLDRRPARMGKLLKRANSLYSGIIPRERRCPFEMVSNKRSLKLIIGKNVAEVGGEFVN